LKRTVRFRFFAILLALLSLLAFSSCSSLDQKLIGRWETRLVDEDLGEMTIVYRFTEEGEIYLEQRQGDEIPFSILFGTYLTEKEKLIIESDGSESVYRYSVSDGELVLLQEGEDAIRFHRV